MDNHAIEQLRKSEAMLEGHFLLSSGRHSDRYFQCARLLQYPDRAAAVLEDVAARIKADIKAGKLKVDVIVGPAMGGIVVAYELGRQLGLPAIFTERDGDGMMCMRRFELDEGVNCLIAEDVVTTAKSSRETGVVLESLGAKVTALACIVDRSTEALAISWPLYSAAKVHVESWEAADCKLCKKGIPAVKPGSRKVFC